MISRNWFIKIDRNYNRNLFYRKTFVAPNGRTVSLRASNPVQWEEYKNKYLVKRGFSNGS